MNDTRKLLIAVQTFKKIIESDFVYAYKNQLALNLMQSSGGLLPDADVSADYGFQSAFSAEIKKDTGILTSSVGMIVNPYQAEHILASQQADMVFLGRALLHDPYWALHAADTLGCEDQIKWPNQYLRAASLKY